MDKIIQFYFILIKWKIIYFFFYKLRRLCFAASREGHLLDILSYVHVRRLTPAPGLIFHVSVSNKQPTQTIEPLIINWIFDYFFFRFFYFFFRWSLIQSLIAAAMVLYGTIDSLIDFFSFTAWIFYGGSMVALIVMRYTKPNHPRPYKVSMQYGYFVRF